MAAAVAVALARQRSGGVGVRSGRYFFRHVFFYYGRVEYTKVTREPWLQYKLQKIKYTRDACNLVELSTVCAIHNK